jgi:hypothetical protein
MECFGVSQIDWGKVAEIAATATATLLAAYLGAKFAFDMQSDREKRKAIAKDIENANLAIFNVRRFGNLFRSLLESLQTPETPFDSHYLVMKPFSSYDFERPAFNFDSLAFLLKANESLLFRLADLQHSLDSTLDLVKRRSEMHYNEVQPAIEALQQEHGMENVPHNFPDLLAAKVGHRLDAVMDSVTTQMLSGLGEDARQCVSLANDLAAAVETVYPGKAERRLWASRRSA